MVISEYCRKKLGDFLKDKVDVKEGYTYEEQAVNDTIKNKIVSNGQEIIIRTSVSKSAIFLKYKEFLTGEEGKCGGYELGSMLSTLALVNMDGKILEVPADWIEFEDD